MSCRSCPRLRLVLALALVLPAAAARAGAVNPDSGAVLLHPGDDVARIVATAPAGTGFRFATGLYRLVQIAPKDGDSFTGEPGAILNGAQLVSGFVRQGTAFAAPLKLAPRPLHGYCERGRLCNRANDVFVGGRRQEPAAGLGGLGPGRFFIDDAAHRVYLGSDPAGEPVEIATARFAFAGQGEDVRIAGLVIEKYANAAQSGAIGGWGRPVHWTIENCEIRANHGVGIEIGANTSVRHSFIHHNGQLGIAGGNSHPAITDNDIADNNQAGFDQVWEAGGIKLTRALHAVVANNFVHANHGTGIWSDMFDIDVDYVGNRVEDNDREGILQEISFDGVIRGNQVRGNGRAPHTWIWGSQILVQNSRDVAVTGNRVGVPEGGTGIILVEQRRDESPFGPHLVRNNLISGNTIELAGRSGIAAGLVTDYSDSRAASGGNRFDDNTYRVPDPDGRFWAWPSWQGDVDFADFRRRFGQEAAGTLAAIPAQ